jgi:hypothetical protein
MKTPDDILKHFLEEARYHADDLIIGKDISTIPELKIMFDGYGENDEGDEDRNNESYAFFIHKDALKKGFIFPNHEITPWALVHRPDQEICLFSWFSTEDDFWSLPEDWNDSINDSALTVKQFELILKGLYKKYPM